MVLVAIIVNTTTLAWFEKTYLEANEKQYEQYKKNLIINLLMFFVANFISVCIALWGLYEVR